MLVELVKNVHSIDITIMNEYIIICSCPSLGKSDLRSDFLKTNKISK